MVAHLMVARRHGCSRLWSVQMSAGPLTMRVAERAVGNTRSRQWATLTEVYGSLLSKPGNRAGDGCSPSNAAQLHPSPPHRKDPSAITAPHLGAISGCFIFDITDRQPRCLVPKRDSARGSATPAARSGQTMCTVGGSRPFRSRPGGCAHGTFISYSAVAIPTKLFPRRSDIVFTLHWQPRLCVHCMRACMGG